MNQSKRVWVPVLGGLLQCLSWACGASAQSLLPIDRGEDPNAYVMQWGPYAYDTRSREGRLQKVACGWNSTAHLRADGRLFVQGGGGSHVAISQWTWTTVVPQPPLGLYYTDVSINSYNAMAIRSDGAAIAWGGWVVPTPPPLPPGLRYEKVSVSTTHGLLLRSDGAVVAFGGDNFGQSTVPVLPPGVAVVDIHAIYGRSLILLADGNVVLFGQNQFGEGVAPTLPPGVRYTALGKQPPGCTLLLRSDGWIEAFGDNALGQCNVPPLPAGMTYEHTGGGTGWAVAVRSDNTFVVWGNASGFGLNSPPVIPAGQRCVQLSTGQVHAAALLTDGSVLSWGHNNFYDHFTPDRSLPGERIAKRPVHTSSGLEHSLITYSDGTMDAFGFDGGGQLNVPPLPNGLRYIKGGAGGVTSLALRSDGEIVGFGWNGFGALNVPPLPLGLTYVDMSVCHGHAVVLRSDGQAFGFGENAAGQCNIPALPVGVTYIDASVNETLTLLLRSDGLLAFCGQPYYGAGPVPQPPAGERFIDIAASGFFAAALASDNSVAVWGIPASPGPNLLQLQPLPAGVYYVEMYGGYWVTTLRRSDGKIDVLGNGGDGAGEIPPIDSGTSCLQITGCWRSPGARMSSTCIYMGFAPGCAGSLPPCRLIPRDTPRIGRTLEVQLDRLPANLALMGMGLQRPTVPIPLAMLGMPGCSLAIQVDAVALLSGQNNKARFQLPIPDLPSLVGLRFYHQALVLDPAAGNGFGAVLSEASEGVIGYP
jgi:alpha-tubulin suppressor-like RCC1 family protein